MATNPMQRKARNSFILGMLVMLLICGLIIAFLIMQLKGKIEKENEEKKASVSVYVLNTDVSSGQTITADMYEKETVNKNRVPSNAIGDMAMLENYALQDKAGNEITTTVESGVTKLEITIENKKYEVKTDEETGNYYYTAGNNDEKTYIELNEMPLIAKVNMKKNTVITIDLISKGVNTITDDVRKQEYNMITMPIDLVTGDYVDIRLMLPNGQDFIVASKKEVEIPNIAGVDSADTFWVNLSESETLSVSSAIVEAYQLEGSKLYVAKYTEAGMQNAAIPTYVPNASVTALIESNPNIVATAMTELRNNRYSSANIKLRNEQINAAINGAGEDSKDNIKEKMTESITQSQTTRKSYLDGLSAEE